MALQKDYINEQNETIPNCYWKIGSEDGIIGGKSMIRCKIYCYENKESADQNKNELYVYNFDYTINMGSPENIIMQLYIHLKEYHGIFDGAIDV